MTGGFQAILVEKITMSRHIKWHELAGARTWFLLALVLDRKSTRLNSSHSQISYAVFCLKKKNRHTHLTMMAQFTVYRQVVLLGPPTPHALLDVLGVRLESLRELVRRGTRRTMVGPLARR